MLHVAGRDTLVWSGIELLCLPLLALGGVGFVSATANLAPAAAARMYDAVAARASSTRPASCTSGCTR